MPQGFSTLFKVPLPDTGLYEGFEFLMSAGDARLKINIAEQPNVELHFSRVRRHEFVAQYNCSAEQISSAYFKLVQITDSPELLNYVRNDKAARKAYKELNHYRIFLDDSGCHDIFAQSWSPL